MSFSGSNNIHFNMPPLMNDGRNFSTFQPESVVNANIQKDANIQSNWDYRRYLQNNATNIMKFNYMDSINASGNNPNSAVHSKASNNTPYMFVSTHDTKEPPYGYNNSDLKQNYLSREQLNARMIAPSIPTNF